MTSRLIKGLAAGAALIVLTAAPAAAQSFTLTANLSGAGEATSIANGVNTGAFGDCKIVVDMGAQTVSYAINVFNLPSGVTASHIHVGAEKTAGPVVVNFVVPRARRTTSGSAARSPSARSCCVPIRGSARRTTWCRPSSAATRTATCTRR